MRFAAVVMIFAGLPAGLTPVVVDAGGAKAMEFALTLPVVLGLDADA